MSRKLTISLIIIGFFFKELSRTLILPNLIAISHFFFGLGAFKAIEMGLLITAQMGASAMACLIFGILADKISRKKAALISLIFWIGGLFIAGFSVNYCSFLIGQLLLGFGSGGFIPVAQAIIGDLTPPNKKGEIYGYSSIFMFLGMFVGLFLASFFTSTWQLPFLIVGLLVAIYTALYGIIGKNYEMGRQEEELRELFSANENYSYDYRLSLKSFKNIFQNKTNALIFVEGIFSLLGVSMILFCFYPYLLNGPAHVTPLVASILFLFFASPSTLFGIYFWGKIGDSLEKKHARVRVLLIAICFTVTTPIYMATFWIQGSPADSTNTLEAALNNPGILLFTILFTIASFINSIYDPNQPPIINSINLPETRGSVYAVNRFVEELGGALGPLLVGIIFEIVGQDFSTAMTIGMLFILPGIFCWWFALKTYPKNRAKVQEVLEARAREALGENISIKEK